MAHGIPIKHASLSRPRLVPVESLPPGAEISRSRTPWQNICEALVKNEGTWFQLTRPYGSVGTAITSARRTLDADYPNDTASRLESASLPNTDGSVTVYLRIAEAQPEDEEEFGEEQVA